MQLIFRLHTLQRMFERQINLDEVHQVIENGEIIEEHPPICGYSNQLMLGWRGKRPLHIVVAYKDTELTEQATRSLEPGFANTGESHSDSIAILVTVYQPDPTRWSEDFRERAE